jgi:hypothetical protein
MRFSTEFGAPEPPPGPGGGPRCEAPRERPILNSTKTIGDVSGSHHMPRSHIFLWTHTGDQTKAAVGLSKVNQKEAEMAVWFAFHLSSLVQTSKHWIMTTCARVVQKVSFTVSQHATRNSVVVTRSQRTLPRRSLTPDPFSIATVGLQPSSMSFPRQILKDLFASSVVLSHMLTGKGSIRPLSAVTGEKSAFQNLLRPGWCHH